MSSSAPAELDDREEGEIVDDENVFEDISDNSISDIEGPFCSGKSVLHKENLRTISLSSVSDGENVIAIRLQHHDYGKRRRKQSRSEKRTSYLKRRISSGRSSDSDHGSRLKKRLKKQLKEAVRTDTTNNTHNSLRDRLQGMVKLSSDCQAKDSEHETMTDSAENKLGSDANGVREQITEYDRELQELRLEALKTAILNKHKHRKKRRLGETEEIVLSDASQKSDVLETNKENSATINRLEVTNQGGTDCSLPVDVSCDHLPSTQKFDLPSPGEDDADALRALLLASISNRATAVMKVDETCDSIKNKVIEIKTVNSPTSIQVDRKNPEVKQTVHGNDIKSIVKNNTHADIKKLSSTKIIRQQGFPVITSQKPSSSRKLPANNFNTTLPSKKSLVNNSNQTTVTKNLMVNAKNRYPSTTLITDVSVLPPVKPLIIKVDTDSDSEEDIMFQDDSICEKNSESVQQMVYPEKTEIAEVSIPIEIQNSLEHLLKQERAKVEAESAFNTPQRRNLKTEILEKSAVKLLPRDKQIEYRNLLRKIHNRTNKNLQAGAAKPLNAIKKLTSQTFINTKGEASALSSEVVSSLPNTTDGVFKKASSGLTTATLEKISSANANNLVGQTKRKCLPPVTSSKPPCTVVTNPVRKSVKLVNSVSKVVKLNHTTCKVVSNKSISDAGVAAGSVLQSASGKLQCESSKSDSNDAKKLRVALRMARKDLYVQNDGRLQIKAQYQSLNNLIKKINKADAEKKKHELHMEKLLEELCEARKQVSQCSQSYSCLVKEFVNKKDFIDKSIKQVVQQKLTTTKEQRIKDVSKSNSACATTSGVAEERATLESKANDVTVPDDLPTVDPSKVIHVAIVKQDCKMSIETQEKCSDKDVAQKLLHSTTSNEMDKITKSQIDDIAVGTVVSGAKTKLIESYVSPLGCSRCQAVNPLGILCPYEVTGSCRDPECKFTHFSANSVETT